MQLLVISSKVAANDLVAPTALLEAIGMGHKGGCSIFSEPDVVW